MNRRSVLVESSPQHRLRFCRVPAAPTRSQSLPSIATQAVAAVRSGRNT